MGTNTANYLTENQIPELGDLPVDESCLEMDPQESAAIAGLVYISDIRPGIGREPAKEGFAYFYPDGRPVTSEKELRRIKALVIPPAWIDVWISPLADSHLQATGRDARGRKQYRYHRLWAQVRSQTKFIRMIPFGLLLPQIRSRVEKDLSLSGLARNKVLATVVRLLETTLIRVGNEEYARENDSFGLTTMQTRHVDVDGPVMRFNFRGKSGRTHYFEVHDRRLARIVRRCYELPGHELFQYLDDENQPRSIDSGDVNEYLFELSGEPFTAKDFRTWGGTRHAGLALAELGPPDSPADAKRKIVQAIKKVAGILGNREATCRKYYVHPAVLESYAEGILTNEFTRLEQKQDSTPPILHADEAVILQILTQWDERKGNGEGKK